MIDVNELSYTIGELLNTQYLNQNVTPQVLLEVNNTVVDYLKSISIDQNLMVKVTVDKTDPTILNISIVIPEIKVNEKHKAGEFDFSRYL